VNPSLCDVDEHRAHKFLYGGHDPGVCCFGFASQSPWMPGYPDKARQTAKEGYSLALELDHPTTVALSRFALGSAHHFPAALNAGAALRPPRVLSFDLGG
jgi:hypothetical protein